ncbi:MAG: ABC transporter permease [Protaetiibacter sp.]
MAENTTVSPSATRAASPRKPSVLRMVLRDGFGRAGAIIAAVMLLAALLAPIISPHDPAEIFTGYRLQPPSAYFPLGTDELGRDLLSRALYGAQASLSVALSVAALASLIGVPIGLISGYWGGLFDATSMRVMDVLFAFPTILLALTVVATLGPETRNLIIALTIVYIPALARITRGATMTVSREVYIDAGRSVGLGNLRLLLRHVLPNAAAPILVQISVALAEIILVEASLSYLGLGVQPPSPSWGGMLASGKANMEISLWPSLVPGLFIVLTVLSFNLLGDALRDSLDPRLRTSQRQ